jgi:hypothetical protein
MTWYLETLFKYIDFTVFKTLKFQFKARNTPNAEQNGFCQKSWVQIVALKLFKCFLQCKTIDLKNKSHLKEIE